MERRGLHDASSARRPLPGLLVLPFALGVGAVLVAAAALGQPLNAAWLLFALLAGAVGAGLSLVWALRRSPLAVAAAAPPVAPPLVSTALALDAAPGERERVPDPLAHIHLVEAQARRHSRPCTNCGTPVKADLDACPSCGHQQFFSCKGCRTQVRLDWSHCPECGRALP